MTAATPPSSPIGEPFHVTMSGERQAGIDPEHTDFSSFAEFADPDGNTYLLQEVRRGGSAD